MNRLLATLGLLSAMVALPAAAQDLTKLGFMTGHWVQKTEREEVQENWLGPRGDMIVGTNLTMTSGR